MASYPIQTTALVSHVPSADGHLQWRKEKVKLREPQADEVLVRIIASGICHTDVTLSALPADMPGFSPYPKVTGHEGAGIIERVGGAVSHVKEGDKVLLSFDYCGQDDCRACVEQSPGYCNQFHEKNILSVPEVYQAEDGNPVSGLFFGQSSFSNLAVVKAKSTLNVSHLVKDEMELQLFAPMGCGYQTGAGAVTELANVQAKDTVVIFGLGGVGMAALMAAKIRGANTIIAVDRVKSRLDLARELGATNVIDTSNLPSLTADLAAAIKEINPLGANFCFDTTSVVPIIDAGVQVLQPKGEVILIGILLGKKLDLDLGTMLAAGTAIRGCIEGNAQPSKFVPQMIDWYRQGKFPVDKLSKNYSCDDFQQALNDMHTGETIKPILLW